MNESRMTYHPHDKQYRFHTSLADNKLYGGAKWGGKSHALRADAINTARSANNLSGIIFRRTYPQLLKSVIEPMLEILPKEIYEYNKTEKRIRFLDTWSIIHFWHCQYEADVINYQGAEYDFMYFDELTQFTEYQFQYLKWSLRTTKKRIKPFVWASANPWGVWHNFVKRLWIDRDLKPDEKKESWEFISAQVYDNEHIMKNDPNYVARLEGLPEEERKALLDWDWNVFKGQYFKDYRSYIHEVEAFEIPETREKVICLDYWFSNPSAVLWLAKDHDNNVWVYRELYVRHYLYTQLVEEIKKIEFVKTMVVDPALRAKDPMTRTSFIDVATKHKFAVVPWINDRVPWWQIMRKMLIPFNNPQQWAKAPLQIFKNCVDLTRTLPALIHDQKKVEDVDTTGEDHAPDALRYGLNYILWKWKALKDIRKTNSQGLNTSDCMLDMNF